MGEGKRTRRAVWARANKDSTGGACYARPAAENRAAM
jgi:hypothetical protein